MNTYLYSNANPLRYVDPLGLHHGPLHGQMGHGAVGPRKTQSTLNILVGARILTLTPKGMLVSPTTGVGAGLYSETCAAPPVDFCYDDQDPRDFAPDAASTTFKNLVGVGINRNGVCVSVGPVLSIPGIQWDPIDFIRY